MRLPYLLDKPTGIYYVTNGKNVNGIRSNVIEDVNYKNRESQISLGPALRLPSFSRRGGVPQPGWLVLPNLSCLIPIGPIGPIRPIGPITLQ